jgi:Domain of unknown function (DUF4340)
MKMKNLSLLAIILIVLVAIIVISNQLQNRKPSEKSLTFLPDFSEATCSEIFVVEGKDSVKLERKGANWIVASPKTSAPASSSSVTSPVAKLGTPVQQEIAKSDEYPAYSAAIQTALDKLNSLKKDDLISQNPQKQAELEVDSAKGVFVEIANDKGKSVGALFIGKNGANWDQNFVREKGSNDVYLSGGSVRSAFFGDKKRWKDKAIVKFDKTFVKKLQIARKDSGTVELVRTTPSPTDTSIKEGWQIVGQEKVKVKKDKVEDLLNTMSKLVAADFETDMALSADSMGFSKPELVVSATLQNGETKTVVMGKKKTSANQYWTKTPDNTRAIFLAYEYNFTSMGQTLNSLKDVPEVKNDAAGAKPAPAGKPGAKPAAPKRVNKPEKEKLTPVMIHKAVP